MKTLLLTLVVVTIMCLDLGYTLRCHNTWNYGYISCEAHAPFCYKSRHYGRTEKPTIAQGCTAKCSEKSEVCCSTDMCNK
uniref:3FTx-Fur-63 n=1 Tax=Furina ornata TaxID=529697 RepID=R4G2G6_9SAUR